MIPLRDQPPDFIAILKYQTTQEGGRKTPALSRYRPAIKFGFSSMSTSGEQVFLDKDIVYPGETVTAEIRILARDHFKNTLNEGVQFEFYEGSRLIGTGRITMLLNEDLRCK